MRESGCCKRCSLRLKPQFQYKGHCPRSFPTYPGHRGTLETRSGKGNAMRGGRQKSRIGCGGWRTERGDGDQGASEGEKGNWERLAQWPEPKPEEPLLCSSPRRCYRDCAPESSAAWPLRDQAGRGQCPKAARRRGAGAQPGPLVRAAPPLAVALAPPSHPNHDVKGDATQGNAESAFPRKRRRRWLGLPLLLRHYAMVRASL